MSRKKSPFILQLQHVQAWIEDKQILHDITLRIPSGEVHAIMGPNGSGKSTLAHVLMGNPFYSMSEKDTSQQNTSSITIQSVPIHDLSPEERAKQGIFLAFQSPVSVPGVSVVNMLRTAYQELHKDETQREKDIQNPVLQRRWQASNITFTEFTAKVKEYAELLHIDPLLLRRGIHDGFSGGEKKKIEMLQALILEPKFAIFDEIDTGLDVDALKIVAQGISLLKKQGTGVIIITHYQRILSYIDVDAVHVIVKGKLAASGGSEFAKKIETEGYASFIHSGA